MNQTNTTFEQAQNLLAIVHRLGLTDAIIGVVQYHSGPNTPPFRPATKADEPGPFVVALGMNGADVGQTLAIAKGRHASVRGFGPEHCLMRVYSMLTAGTEKEINDPGDFRLHMLATMADVQTKYESALAAIVAAE